MALSVGNLSVILPFACSGSLHNEFNFAAVMTISKSVTSEMFESGAANQPKLIRMVQRFSGSSTGGRRKASTIGWWTTEEHNKFLEAMELYPSGPWKKIARHVESRTSRQVMTHAQKYRQRIKRRANSKSRGKATREPWAKTADDVFTKHTAENKSNSATEILKVVGDEKLEWWETPLQHEAVQLEPLPLLQVCELPQQFTQELSVTDPLLLDELQQLIAPVAGDVLLEAGNWDGDELLELLIGTMDD